MSKRIEIWAVDFDGTLCESVWPGIGSPNTKLINFLIKSRKEGIKLILWTCREGEKLREAVEWCKEQGLEFDAVNDNLTEMIALHGGNNCRKVWAAKYIDDLAADKEKYGIPFHGEPVPDKKNDEMLSIDEIIAHCERFTERYEAFLEKCGHDESNITDKQYWEHRQVKKYLYELKQYRSIGTVEKQSTAAESSITAMRPVFIRNKSDTVSVWKCGCGAFITTTHEPGILKGTDIRFCSQCGCEFDFGSEEDKE